MCFGCHVNCQCHSSVRCGWQRFLDLSFTTALFPFVILLTCIFGYIIKIAEKDAVFFFQERLGYRGTRFVIVKLRTMQRGTCPRTISVTRLGAWLRRASLDEIPSFLNVLVGDLTLVGPRPLLPADEVLLRTLCYERFMVKPGVTGIAQVAGRNSLSWRRRLNLDASYIKKLSTFWYLVILALTSIKVFENARYGVRFPTVSSSLEAELNQ